MVTLKNYIGMRHRASSMQPIYAKVVIASAVYNLHNRFMKLMSNEDSTQNNTSSTLQLMCSLEGKRSNE